MGVNYPGALQVYTLCADGRLGHVRVGLSIRISGDQVEAYLVAAGAAGLTRSPTRRRGQRPAPADVLEALREAVDGTRRVTEIVQALKILGRTSPTTQPTEVNLRKVLDATLAVAGNDLRRRARLVCELSEVPPVVGDEGRLGQVLLDLLNNAVQAIEAGHPEENTIMVRLRHVGEQVLVEVADTGTSIASGDLARVFDPFFPARWPVGGFGRGLAVAQRIATELGGTIEAQSRPGEGAAFRLSLPEARQGGADRQ